MILNHWSQSQKHKQEKSWQNKYLTPWKYVWQYTPMKRYFLCFCERISFIYPFSIVLWTIIVLHYILLNWIALVGISLYCAFLNCQAHLQLQLQLDLWRWDSFIPNFSSHPPTPTEKVVLIFVSQSQTPKSLYKRKAHFVISLMLNKTFWNIWSLW